MARSQQRAVCDRLASDPLLMGGLDLDEKSAVLGLDSLPVPRLFTAGEVARGVHGHNRLGGNSLLDCAGFGRVAGAPGRCHFRAAGRIADLLALGRCQHRGSVA